MSLMYSSGSLLSRSHAIDRPAHNNQQPATIWLMVISLLIAAPRHEQKPWTEIRFSNRKKNRKKNNMNCCCLHHHHHRRLIVDKRKALAFLIQHFLRYSFTYFQPCGNALHYEAHAVGARESARLQSSQYMLNVIECDELDRRNRNSRRRRRRKKLIVSFKQISDDLWIESMWIVDIDGLFYFVQVRTKVAIMFRFSEFSSPSFNIYFFGDHNIGSNRRVNRRPVLKDWWYASTHHFYRFHSVSTFNYICRFHLNPQEWRWWSIFTRENSYLQSVSTGLVNRLRA